MTKLEGSKRPSTHVKKEENGAYPLISRPHPHEYGIGRDIQYKDAAGNVNQSMHGLRMDEAEFLAKKHGIKPLD